VDSHQARSILTANDGGTDAIRPSCRKSTPSGGVVSIIARASTWFLKNEAIFRAERTGSHLYAYVSGEATVLWASYFTFAMGGVGGAGLRAHLSAVFDGVLAHPAFLILQV
jgi:hypothetical protein